uniref:riboflavin kinase n=1 Tax=Aegilops tauschii subsp. strangulata TaxID=200361 RepID=A0A453FJG2_AEGTS
MFGHRRFSCWSSGCQGFRGEGIQGALAMEPLLSNAQIGDAVQNSTLTLIAGECTYDSIPDQISGIFFGWTKSETYGVFKAVVSTGWDLSPGKFERVMHICFLDSHYKAKTEDHLELLLIGYIRKLQSSENISQAMNITDEDQATARDALDLPAFSEYAKTRSALDLPALPEYAEPRNGLLLA